MFAHRISVEIGVSSDRVRVGNEIVEAGNEERISIGVQVESISLFDRQL